MYYYLDSYSIHPITQMRSDYPTMYCNNKQALDTMVSIAKEQNRKGIVTGKADFNQNGVLVKLK